MRAEETEAVRWLSNNQRLKIGHSGIPKPSISGWWATCSELP